MTAHLRVPNLFAVSPTTVSVRTVILFGVADWIGRPHGLTLCAIWSRSGLSGYGEVVVNPLP